MLFYAVQRIYCIKSAVLLKKKELHIALEKMLYKALYVLARCFFAYVP